MIWLGATFVLYALSRLVVPGRGVPLAATVLALIGLLVATHTPYETYFEGAKPLHLLLGPATVALAVPLYEHRSLLRKSLGPLVGALVAGSLTATLSTIAIARAFGASLPVKASLAPKSVTTPIAMGISELLGGIPSLTAAIVIVTGIAGGLFLTPLCRALRVHDPRAIGLAAGVSAHGVGTARAFEFDFVSGTFSGVAVALNGILTSLYAPFLSRLF